MEELRNIVTPVHPTGIHVDCRNRKGMSPLAMAVHAGHTDLARALLKKSVSGV